MSRIILRNFPFIAHKALPSLCVRCDVSAVSVIVARKQTDYHRNARVCGSYMYVVSRVYVHVRACVMYSCGSLQQQEHKQLPNAERIRFPTRVSSGNNGTKCMQVCQQN